MKTAPNAGWIRDRKDLHATNSSVKPSFGNTNSGCAFPSLGASLFWLLPTRFSGNASGLHNLAYLPISGQRKFYLLIAIFSVDRIPWISARSGDTDSSTTCPQCAQRSISGRRWKIPVISSTFTELVNIPDVIFGDRGRDRITVASAPPMTYSQSCTTSDFWTTTAMRIPRIIPFLALTVSCTPQDVVPLSRSAQFPENPVALFRAFENSCQEPGETLSRPAPTTLECRQLLSPDATAYLILTYDGYPQDLPESVTRLTATENPAGYRVDAEMFLDVPQKDGRSLNVQFESRRLDRMLARLYRAAGGTPI
ncbi:MAG: hypothetical protein AB3N21_19915 [Ruegeria sp.]|uniref:hypothetical protein n=1 Tax=Ruegeria sp. TaxID=1879320 RepID=UPI00349E88FA